MLETQLKVLAITWQYQREMELVTQRKANGVRQSEARTMKRIFGEFMPQVVEKR